MLRGTARFDLENELFSSETKHVSLFFLNQGANVHATTATGDTALTYACENGHTDVADVLLQDGANLVFYSLGSSLWCAFPSFCCDILCLTELVGTRLFRNMSLKGDGRP